MSKTFTVHPILGCLREFEKFVKNDEWISVSKEQEEFIEKFVKTGMSDLLKFEDGELKCKAGTSIEEINKWLADNGFPDLQLEPIDDPTAFAVASILHVFLQWLQEGTETTITYQDEEYPSAKLDYREIDFFKMSSHDNPIVKIPTKRVGEYVFMTISDKENCMGFAEIIKNKSKEFKSVNHKYKGVIFPTIDYDEKVDISFLEKMENPGDDPTKDPWFIVEAIQQTKFKMNHKGAEVESAAAMSGMRCCSIGPSPMIINKPFMMAIVREELEHPYFVGYFTEEDWKEVEIDFGE